MNNDVNWRTLDDDGERLLKENPYNTVLVKTDVTLRIDVAQNIQDGRLVSANENVIKFAFV